MSIEPIVGSESTQNLPENRDPNATTRDKLAEKSSRVVLQKLGLPDVSNRVHPVQSRLSSHLDPSPAVSPSSDFLAKIHANNRQETSALPEAFIEQITQNPLPVLLGFVPPLLKPITNVTLFNDPLLQHSLEPSFPKESLLTFTSPIVARLEKASGATLAEKLKESTSAIVREVEEVASFINENRIEITAGQEISHKQFSDEAKKYILSPLLDLLQSARVYRTKEGTQEEIEEATIRFKNALLFKGLAKTALSFDLLRNIASKTIASKIAAALQPATLTQEQLSTLTANVKQVLDLLVEKKITDEAFALFDHLEKYIDKQMTFENLVKNSSTTLQNIISKIDSNIVQKWNFEDATKAWLH